MEESKLGFFNKCGTIDYLKWLSTDPDEREWVKIPIMHGPIMLKNTTLKTERWVGYQCLRWGLRWMGWKSSVTGLDKGKMFSLMLETVPSNWMRLLLLQSLLWEDWWEVVGETKLFIVLIGRYQVGELRSSLSLHHIIEGPPKFSEMQPVHSCFVFFHRRSVFWHFCLKLVVA